jgi:hypothetical protein
MEVSGQLHTPAVSSQWKDSLVFIGWEKFGVIQNMVMKATT